MMGPAHVQVTRARHVGGADESLVLEGRYTLQELQELVRDWESHMGDAPSVAAGGACTLAEPAAGGLSEEGRRRRAECPQYLKRCVRAAVKRHRQALHDALKYGLDIGADGGAVFGAVIDQLLGELPDVIGRRWAAARGAVSHKGQQGTDGAPAGVEGRSAFVISHGGVSVRVELVSVGAAS